MKFSNKQLKPIILLSLKFDTQNFLVACENMFNYILGLLRARVYCNRRHASLQISTLFLRSVQKNSYL